MNNPDLHIAKFLTRETEQTFRQAVRIVYDLAEEKTLLDTVKILSEWAGNILWEKGYDFTKLQTMAKKFDYDYQLGLGITISAKRRETIRQFCYQFVSMTEKVTKENDRLQEHIRYLESSKWLKFINFFRKQKKGVC